MAIPTSAQRRSSPLALLPAELQLEVANHLAGTERLSLRMAGSRLYNLIEPLSHAEMLEATRTERRKRRFPLKFLPCRNCPRLRPTRRFRLYGASDANLWCVDCEIESTRCRRFYRRGPHRLDVRASGSVLLVRVSALRDAQGAPSRAPRGWDVSAVSGG